jgi:hypothetical protein
VKLAYVGRSSLLLVLIFLSLLLRRIRLLGGGAPLGFLLLLLLSLLLPLLLLLLSLLLFLLLPLLLGLLLPLLLSLSVGLALLAGLLLLLSPLLLALLLSRSPLGFLLLLLLLALLAGGLLFSPALLGLLSLPSRSLRLPGLLCLPGLLGRRAPALLILDPLLLLKLAHLLPSAFVALCRLSRQSRDPGLSLLVAHPASLGLSLTRSDWQSIWLGDGHNLPAVGELELSFALLFRHRLDLETPNPVRCNRRNDRTLAGDQFTVPGLPRFNRYIHSGSGRLHIRRELSHPGDREWIDNRPRPRQPGRVC